MARHPPHHCRRTSHRSVGLSHSPISGTARRHSARSALLCRLRLEDGSGLGRLSGCCRREWRRDICLLRNVNALASLVMRESRNTPMLAIVFDAVARCLSGGGSDSSSLWITIASSHELPVPPRRASCASRGVGGWRVALRMAVVIALLVKPRCWFVNVSTVTRRTIRRSIGA